MHRRRRHPTPTSGCTRSRTGSARRTRLNLDGIFGDLPNVAWTTAGPIHPDDPDAPAPFLSSATASRCRGSTSSRACSTTSPPGSAHRRRLARAPRRLPLPRDHRHARGLRQLTRNGGHLDGRGTHLAGRRRGFDVPRRARAQRIVRRPFPRGDQNARGRGAGATTRIPTRRLGCLERPGKESTLHKGNRWSSKPWSPSQRSYK